MYETVIWVALVAAVLSFIFEMIYRKVFIGAGRVGGCTSGHDHRGQGAASGPEHQEPCSRCLRSNLWLTIHVLTEVSSYAAFALAWMLGLIATTYYLTATYRRSPRFRNWHFRSWSALPLLRRSAELGVAASYGLFGPRVDARRQRRLRSSQPSLERRRDVLRVRWHRTCWVRLIALTGLLAVGGEVLESHDVPARRR